MVWALAIDAGRRRSARAQKQDDGDGDGDGDEMRCDGRERSVP